jgi:protein-S-isoprenylcysteine O-methyltransferase Ste14
MAKRLAFVLRLSLVVITVLGAGALLAPWILFAASSPFPGRLEASVVFSAVVARELFTSCLRMPKKVQVAPSKDWTAAAVGFGYVAVLYACLVDVYLRRLAFPLPGVSALGVSLYAAGLLLRTVALRHLGEHWSVQLDQASSPGASLIRSGPYAYIRHPIYLGAMLENAGVALLFASPAAFAISLAGFCPAELARARFEERALLASAGEPYAAYRREVGGFVPRKWFRRRA